MPLFSKTNMSPNNPGCTTCEGCPFGGKAVGSRGSLDAELVIVGEGPGSNEFVRGLPFVGESGHLLDDCLKKAGLPEDTPIFVTNALRCRPPAGTPPGFEEITACRPRLLDELAQHSHKVILALGNTAVKAVTGRDGIKITQIRGQTIESTYGLIVPTFHPAAILRNAADYKKMLDDIRYAIELFLTGNRKKPGETKFAVTTSDEKFDLAIIGLKKQALAQQTLGKQLLLGADIETTGFNPRQDRTMCLGISWEKNKTLIFPERFLPRLIETGIFSDPNIRWVWHNGKFDTSFLHTLGIPAKVDEDTMLLHYALCEQRGTHDLKQLSTVHLGAEDYEAALKPYKGEGGSFEPIPKKILYPYLARDCDYTLQLFHILMAELQKDPKLVRLYYDLLIPASAFLQTVEDVGMYINKKDVEILRTTLTQRKEIAYTLMQEFIAPYWDPETYASAVGAIKVPKEFNPGSPKQLSWILYGLIKLHPAPGMRQNTAEETLKTLGDHPFVEALLNYREVSKALSTYVEGISECIEEDGRTHSTYLLHGTSTGRLSSRGPNAQNIPRDGSIRDIFQAPPGRKLVEVDYSGAELRSLAHLSGDKFMTQVFLDGRDLHDEVSLAMYGPNFDSEQRMRSKALNFGIMYGRSEYSLVKEYKISLEEAREMIDKWFKRFPQAHKYLLACRQAPLKRMAIRSPFGRLRRFGLVTLENTNALQNESCNFSIQSMSSDLTLSSAMEADEPLRVQYDSNIINLVHDSILVECPDNSCIAASVALYIMQVMCEMPKKKLNSTVPFSADCKIGHKWGSLKKTKREELLRLSNQVMVEVG